MWNPLFDSNEEGRLTILISGVILFVIGYIVYLLFTGLKFGKNKNIGDQGYECDGITEKMNRVPAVMHFIEAGTVFFGLWYIFVGFPISTWSQANQYDARVSGKELLNNSVSGWESQEVQKAAGRQLYNIKCAACHGESGDGLNGQAANLKEFGTEKHIRYVIENGSKGLGKLQPSMPNTFYQILGEQGATDVAAYTITLSGKTPHVGDPEKGKALFTTCSTCHGPEGKPTVPNFAADLSEYGTASYIEDIIRRGKKGHIGTMPSFEEEGTMNDRQFKALASYVANEISGQ